jgi:thiamine biosynthesis lipoprotein
MLALNRAWTCFQEDSLISKINRAAGSEPVSVDMDTFEVLRLSKLYSDLTEGAFDVTVGPLADLWREAIREQRLPTDEGVWNALKLVGWRDMEIDEGTSTVRLRQPGQRIDLGGIAKGYAADGLKERLKARGVRRALLDLGGTVATLGCRLPVGVRDPFRPDGAPMGTLMLEDRVAVTSGVYERCAWVDGRRYHHIADPRTGYPAQSGLVSVTLVGERGAALDALATAALILGPERTMPLLKAQSMDAVFVTDQGQVLVTRGLKNQFRLLNKTNTAGADLGAA